MLQPRTPRKLSSIENQKLLDRYRARVATFPEGIEMLKEVQTGKGMVYYNNPLELINRLELLGGSIKAGNNSLKNEFSGIAHKLRDLGSLNNKQLSSLLKNIYTIDIYGEKNYYSIYQ